MLGQSRISENNIRYLESLVASEAKDVASSAVALLEVARLSPGKRRRWSRLKQHPELLRSLARLGLIPEYADYGYADYEGLEEPFDDWIGDEPVWD